MTWKSILLAAVAIGTMGVGATEAATFYYRLPNTANAAQDAASQPSPFSVPAVTAAPRGSAVSSSSVTPGGYTAPAQISVSGDPSATISIAGGPPARSGTLYPGQSFQLTLTASTAGSATSSATITVGGTSATWSVTTTAPVNTPQAFSIAAVTGAPANTVTTSAAVTPSGYTDPSGISISGDASAQISVAGGPWSSSATISPGQSFQARVTSAPADGSSRTLTVSIGARNATWSVKSVDTTPDAFAIAALTGQAPNSTVTSTPVTTSGIDSPTTITVTGDPSARISVAGGPYATSGTITNGQSFTVQMATASGPGSQQAVVTVGGVGVAWNVSTRTLDTAPDAFAIAATSGVAPGTVGTSSAITPTGFLDPAAISVSGDASARVSVAGGAYATSGTIAPGQSFTVQMTAGDTADGSAKTATVSIGGTTASWTMKVQDQIPDGFALSPTTGAGIGAYYTSNAVTVTGIDTPVTATCSGGCSNIARNGSWSGGTSVGGVGAGDTVTLQMQASGSFGTAKTVTLAIGSATATWTVTTGASAVISVTSATYGGNCGANGGNVTTTAQSLCNGRASCVLPTDNNTYGDPTPMCRKDFSVQWNCSGGSGKSAYAWEGDGVTLSCP